MYVQTFGRDQDPVRSQTSVSSPATELHVIGRISVFAPYFFVLAHGRIFEAVCGPRASQLAARRATGLVSNDTSDPIRSFMSVQDRAALSSCNGALLSVGKGRHPTRWPQRMIQIRSFMSVRDKTSRAASDNSKNSLHHDVLCALIVVLQPNFLLKCLPQGANMEFKLRESASVWMQGLRQHQRKKSVQRSPGVWWQKLTHNLGGDTSERKLLPTATRHNCSKFAPSWAEKRGKCKCGCSRTATKHSS